MILDAKNVTVTRGARTVVDQASLSVSAGEIVAVVGDGMAGTPGIAARFLGTLGSAGINVRAIAQGSSERNISVVIDGEVPADGGFRRVTRWFQCFGFCAWLAER